MRRLMGEVPAAAVEPARLDLGDLASVREFAYGLPYERVDLLVNNAGVMALPHGTTVDGFETQFGVNHLGHFALTGLLLPSLLAAPGARIVTVSSVLHALARVDPRDLNSVRRYGRWTAYARSKSANLLFTHELARRLAGREGASDVRAVAAHPGYAETGLHGAGPRAEGVGSPSGWRGSGAGSSPSPRRPARCPCCTRRPRPASPPTPSPDRPSRCGAGRPHRPGGRPGPSTTRWASGCGRPPNG